MASSARRIDLLCLDTDANLVVVELKRTADGGYMDLQAIRYAAMVSTMTFPQVLEAYHTFRGRSEISIEQAQGELLNFLNWSEQEEEQFAERVKILLVAADFSRELTTSVLWLNRQGLDVKCIRLKPYKTNDGRVMLDIQQIIPLPEAAEYQTRLKIKEQAGQRERGERYDLRYAFWEGLLSYAKTKTPLHANRTAGIYGWIGGSIGRAGFSLNYSIRGQDSQVELYIDQGADSDDRNLASLQALKEHQTEIEKEFGTALEWQELPESRACRVRCVVEGGYRSPKEDWPHIFEMLVDKMIRLDRAFRPWVQRLELQPT